MQHLKRNMTQILDAAVKYVAAAAVAAVIIVWGAMIAASFTLI